MMMFSIHLQVASRAKVNSPPLRIMMNAIQKVFSLSLSFLDSLSISEEAYSTPI